MPGRTRRSSHLPPPLSHPVAAQLVRIQSGQKARDDAKQLGRDYGVLLGRLAEMTPDEIEEVINGVREALAVEHPAYFAQLMEFYEKAKAWQRDTEGDRPSPPAEMEPKGLCKLALTENTALALRSIVDERLVDLENGCRETFDGEADAVRWLKDRAENFLTRSLAALNRAARDRRRSR